MRQQNHVHVCVFLFSVSPVCSNVQGDGQTSICITIEPGLLLKGDILVLLHHKLCLILLKVIKLSVLFCFFLKIECYIYHYSYRSDENGYSYVYETLWMVNISLFSGDEGSVLVSLTSKCVCPSSLWHLTTGGTGP